MDYSDDGEISDEANRSEEVGEERDARRNRAGDDFFSKRTYNSKHDIIAAVLSYHQLHHRSYNIKSSDERR